MSDFENRRRDMVQRQIAGRGVRDRRVLDALLAVPREVFVPERLHELAYDDTALPIEEEQTISQPYIVALMAEALEIGPDDRLLEVGAGSGYAAAVLSRIAREVYAIERHSALAELARERMRRLGYTNVHIIHGDGTLGWPEHAPYDAIAVAAGGPDVPPALQSQLAAGGRLVIPIGTDPRLQELVRLRRTGPDEFKRESLGAVRFVPLVGAQGWQTGEGGRDLLPFEVGGLPPAVCRKTRGLEASTRRLTRPTRGLGHKTRRLKRLTGGLGQETGGLGRETRWFGGETRGFCRKTRRFGGSRRGFFGSSGGLAGPTRFLTRSRARPASPRSGAPRRSPRMPWPPSRPAGPWSRPVPWLPGSR